MILGRSGDRSRARLKRTVVVTGGGSGIGEACVCELARSGFSVFAGVYGESERERIEALGSPGVRALPLDITDAASVAWAAREVSAAVGESGLWGLVNNAGVILPGPLEFYRRSEFREQLEINVVGQVAVIQAFLPILRKGRGRIINMSSFVSDVAVPMLGGYCASKHAFEALSDSLRGELSSWGLPVSVVRPGIVRTSLWDKTLQAGKDLVNEQLPAPAIELYGDIIENQRRNALAIREGGRDPTDTGRVISRLMSARLPARCTTVGTEAHVVRAMQRLLTDRRFDALISHWLERESGGTPEANARNIARDRLDARHAVQRDKKPTVIVTDASSGIGMSCALRMAQRGFRVCAGARDSVGVLRVEKMHPNIRPLHLDVTDPESIHAAQARICGESKGPVAGLVNNAGVVTAGPIELIPLDELRAQLETNVVGTLEATRTFLPLLRRWRGRVVNVGSTAGLVSSPFLGAYCASQFALETLTDCLRRELRPWDIEVSMVESGKGATEIWEKIMAYAQALEDSRPPERRALYRRATDRFRRGAVATSVRSSSPKLVARAIEDALLAARPRTRYVVGMDARAAAVASKYVPASIRDQLPTM